MCSGVAVFIPVLRIYDFSSYPGRKYHIRVSEPGANTISPYPDRKYHICVFEPGYGEIVYYAPREEKTWTVHSSCKLPPEPKARVENTSCGLANFIPVVHILFFAIPGCGEKCIIRVNFVFCLVKM